MLENKQALTGRELTDDEQYILYGRPASNSMTFFKTDSFNCIVDLMESVFNGEVVNLPFAPKNNCMYLFYDLPVGTKYYFYDINNYHAVDRQTIGDTSLVEMKYKLNTFLLPNILDGMKKIDSAHWKSDTIVLPGRVYGTVGIQKYDKIGEFFSAGLLVNTNGTQVISITSALAKINQNEKMGHNKQNIDLEHSLLSDDGKKEQLAWTSYCIPIDVQQRCNIPNISDMSFANLNLPSTYFNWTKELYFIVSNKYLRINGFVLNNDVPQLALTHGDFLSNFKTGQTSYLSRAVNTLSNNIENFIFSSGDYQNLNMMFVSGTTTGIRGSYSYKNSVIAFNKDVLEISNKPYLHSINYSEHISLDGGVLEDLRESFITSPINKDTYKYAKTEFRLSPEPLASEESYVSHRYDIIKTSDKKLLFLTKTSKAKDALKQARISRKITESCSSVINFAINLFAACDFEFASSDRSLAMSTYSRGLTGYGATTWNSFPNEVGAALLADIDTFKVQLVTHTPALAQKSIDNLYTTFTESHLLKFNDYPIMSACKQQPYYYNRGFFATCTLEEQKLYCFNSLFKMGVQRFNGAIFSPSSNNLYFVSLYRNIYQNFNFFSKNERLGLEKEGARFHRYYTNNFISISESMDKAVEANKNSGYMSYYEDTNVPISTAFTWSQEASDAWSVTRKCKTFTDYYNWYKNLYDVINHRINTIIKPKDEIGSHLLLEIAKSYLAVLEGLSKAEASYLPAPKVSKRKIKVTTAITSTTTVVEEPEVEEDTMENETSTEMITSALLQTPLKEEINESNTTRVE